jgi:copper chaperone CopZ
MGRSGTCCLLLVLEVLVAHTAALLSPSCAAPSLRALWTAGQRTTIAQRSRNTPTRVDTGRLRMTGGGSADDIADGGNACPSAVEVRLDVGGMKCGGCASRVQSLLMEEDGVLEVAVSLPAKMAIVSVDKERGNPSALVQALNAKGFQAARAHHGWGAFQALADQQSRQDAQCREMLRAVQLILLLNLPSLVFVFAPQVGERVIVWLLENIVENSSLSVQAVRSLIGLGQAVVAMCTVGRRFYRSSYEALLAGYANMDVLIALGATASFVFSSASMLLGRCEIHAIRLSFSPCWAQD